MKQLIRWCLSVFALSVVTSVSSQAALAANYCGNGATPFDHGIPWPWGSEVKIPLRDIAGVWKTTDNSCENWFVFQVASDQSGEKVVTITQYDPSTCKVVAQGVGYQTDRYIYAQLVRKGVAYNLTIRGFNQADVEDSVESSEVYHKVSYRDATPSGLILAMSLFPLGTSEQRSAYQISRIELATSMVCQ